jgi:phage gp45-like
MSDRISLLEQRVDQLERLLRLQVALARSTAPVVDTGVIQTIQGKIDPVSIRDGMPVLLNFGFSSSLPIGGDHVAVFLNGDRSQPLVVGTNHQRYRYKGLNPGETVLYDMYGNTILLNGAGIQMTASAAVQVNAPALITSGNVVVGTGATGSFATATGSMITVADGIITNMS